MTWNVTQLATTGPTIVEGVVERRAPSRIRSCPPPTLLQDPLHAYHIAIVTSGGKTWLFQIPVMSLAASLPHVDQFLLYRGESKPFSTPLVGLLDFWHIEVGLDAHLRLP
jgi:hypothetical protein